MAETDDQRSGRYTPEVGKLRDLVRRAVRKPRSSSIDGDVPPEPDEPCPALCNPPRPRCNAGGAAALLAV
jgi:hypothetical protein